LSRRVGLRTIRSIGGLPCKVTVSVLQDGVAVSEHKILIATRTYKDGDSPRFSMGSYALSWQSGNGAYLYRWETSDKLSVANAYEGSTTLTVTCGGTLTLKLTSDPVWSYDNLVGTIWLEDPGYSGYDNRT